MFVMDHTCLNVENLEKERLFYEKALNFQVDFIRQHSEKVKSVFMRDAQRGCRIQLLCDTRSEEWSGQPMFGHLGVWTKDIMEAYQVHMEMNCVVSSIVDQGVQKSYFIEDPEGYRIEVFQPVKSESEI